MKKIKQISVLSALLLTVTACSTLGLSSSDNEKKPVDVKGKRESVATNAQQIKANAGVGNEWIKLPSAMKNTDWPQAGGTAQNTAGHPALAATITRAWRADIGDGSSSGLRLLARPLIVANVAYAMDASGHVAAFDLQTGERLWRISTQIEDSEAAAAIGGGIAFDQGKIFATTGHAEVLALAANDGHVLWRRKLSNPLRAAPTVADGRVFVVTVNNSASALNTADGTVQWTHNGMAQTAALMGAANPAVADDTVAVAYSSGEIFALRAQNGRVAWGDVLVAPMTVGAMPEMADIRGAPVIDHGGVFAMGHGGRMAALVVRSGERAWELDVGGSNTPIVAGNTLYMLTNNQNLLAVRRDNGKIIWTQDLPRLTDPDDRTSTAITWTGPVLAGGRLMLVNNAEKLVEYSAVDGKLMQTHDLPSASFIAPVVAQGTLLTVTESGHLVAFR